MGLISPDETSPSSSSSSMITYILSYDRIKPLNPIQRVKEFLSWAETIVSSEVRKQIFLYFLENPAATTMEVMENLGLSYPSVYREIKNLVKFEIIEPIVSAKYIKNLPGRSPGIFGLKGFWRPEDVTQAVEKYRQIRVPNYSLIRIVSQSIMDDFLSPRAQKVIKIREVVVLCKKKCPGYFSWDIAKQVGGYLEKRGVEVLW